MTTIDSREESPADDGARTRSGRAASALAFNDARWSGLSAGVPGTVAGWQRALQRYGTWSLGETLRPGIRVARDGFVVDQTFVDQTDAQHRLFQRRAVHGRASTSTRTARRATRAPRSATRDLARTYRQIARDGASAFYRGEIAEAIVEAAQNPPIADDANHTLAPRPRHAARPPPLRRARAHADADRLPRPRRLGHRPALERRLDRGRGAQHPRGLLEPRAPTAPARST